MRKMFPSLLCALSRHDAVSKVTSPIHQRGEKMRTKELLRLNCIRSSTYLRDFAHAVTRGTLTQQWSFRANIFNMMNQGGRHDA